MICHLWLQVIYVVCGTVIVHIEWQNRSNYWLSLQYVSHQNKVFQFIVFAKAFHNGICQICKNVSIIIMDLYVIFDPFRIEQRFMYCHTFHFYLSETVVHCPFIWHFYAEKTHISAYSVLSTYTTRQQSCTNTLYIVFDKEYFRVFINFVWYVSKIP